MDSVNTLSRLLLHITNITQRYCQFNKFPGSWRDVIEFKIDRPMLKDHLDWMCNTLNINSEGTSWQYWRQFKQLYNVVNGRHVDTNDSIEVKKVQLRYPSILALLIACP